MKNFKHIDCPGHTDYEAEKLKEEGIVGTSVGLVVFDEYEHIKHARWIRDFRDIRDSVKVFRHIDLPKIGGDQPWRKENKRPPKSQAKKRKAARRRK